MTLDGFLRRLALRLAPWGGGPAPLVRSRSRALRAVLSTLLVRRRLPAVLQALDGAGKETQDGGARSDLVIQALARLPVSCLWRALAGYAALRQRGVPVRFVLGVRTTGGSLLAHAWLERDGVPLGEREDPRPRFAVAFVHPGSAREPSQEVHMSDPAGSPDVILTELEDGTGVLLHLGTKFYYTLNRTGVVVWKLLAAGVTDPDALARDVAARFPGASNAQARADIVALLVDLRAEGIEPGAR